MLWYTLYSRIRKQPAYYTNKNHVYALLENPKTGETEKVYLDIMYDAKGHPYLVKHKSELPQTVKVCGFC